MNTGKNLVPDCIEFAYRKVKNKIKVSTKSKILMQTLICTKKKAVNTADRT